jgi:hypothetical protein
VTFATPFDDQAPSAPADLAAQVAGSNVDLSWTASADNVGVTGYEVHRNGELLATLGDVTTYSDTTASAETDYEYTVRALDLETNRSEPSNTATATVPDAQAPTVPSALSARPTAPTRVDLSWTASTDNERTRSLLLAEHGGLSISPHLRPDVVERTGIDSYSAEQVLLSARGDYEFASQNAHL